MLVNSGNIILKEIIMRVQKIFLIIVSILAITSLGIQAEQLLETERHNIHYNAFNSSMLSPETASQYNIQRSRV